MSGWKRDTLFLRLFLLMLAALMLSHLVAWAVSTRLLPPPGHASPATAGPAAAPPLPPLGTLPPTPGLPDAGGAGRAPPPPGGSGGPPRLSTAALLADYAIRIVLIGIAAWWGARWIARPVRRMVTAAQGLVGGVAQGQAPAPLDEQAGPAEVREAAQVFNRMAAQLAQEFRGRGLLMASISHDLRTPLTRMRMRLENHPQGAISQRCIEDIREMDGLIDGAIQVFRAEDPSDEPPQSTDVHALVQALADDLAEQGQKVSMQGHPVVATVKPQALRRAVSNLVGNALRYGGSAELTVMTMDGVRIRIEDRGPGIPPEHLQRVMEPFYRVDPSRSRETGGTGLGLFIARDLLRRQGATLDLSNRPGGGLRVEIRLASTAAG